MEILLAEDNATLREGLTVLLESEGYTVRAVADGVAALEQFERRRPGGPRSPSGCWPVRRESRGHTDTGWSRP